MHQLVCRLLQTLLFTYFIQSYFITFHFALFLVNIVFLSLLYQAKAKKTNEKFKFNSKLDKNSVYRSCVLEKLKMIKIRLRDMDIDHHII